MGARFVGIIILFVGFVLPAFAQASQYKPISPATFLSSVPGSFTPCATDFHTCKVTTTGIVSVFYGAKGKYVMSQGQGDFTCLPGTFGINDPVPNVQKTCWVFAGFAGAPDTNPAGSPDTTLVNSVPAGMNSCAVDFGTCKVSGMWTGVYGTNGKYQNIAGTGDFTCLPGTFGIDDPVPYVKKTCYVAKVTFGSFTLTEASPTLSTLVPGIQYSYLLLADDGTQRWSNNWPVKAGQSISNLPSLTSYHLIVSVTPPAGYSVDFGTPCACPESVELPQSMNISAQKTALDETISYQVVNKVVQMPTISTN